MKRYSSARRGLRYTVPWLMVSMALWIVLSAIRWSGEPASIRERRAAVNPSTVTGLPIGGLIPVFRAKDQNGNWQDFSSVRGRKGAVLYFHRSAAWCIYCRVQLLQMEESKEALLRNGLGLAAISSDSPEALRRFADETRISFTLLADPGSRIIREFNVLDASVLPGSPAYGVAYHGSYIVNEAGVIESKLFDVERSVGHSSGVVVTNLFGSPLNTHEKVVKHDLLRLRYYASSNSASAGDQVNLTIDVLLNDEVHVYPPGAGNYIPVSWELQSSPMFASQPVDYPLPKMLILPSAQEKVPIYEGTFRISRAITINPNRRENLRAVDSQGNIVIRGTFRFQACDEEMCFLPRSVPLEWKLASSIPLAQSR